MADTHKLNNKNGNNDLPKSGEGGIRTLGTV